MGERQQGKTHIRVLLTEDELQLSAIDDLCNKYSDWLVLSKESAGGRKTRAANRRVDTIYEEIMAFKLPPIKIRTHQVSPSKPSMKSIIQGTSSVSSSAKSSVDGSEGSSISSSEPRGRTLRPRSRTPSVTRQPQSAPSTPTHQSIRAAMKKTPDSANVLSAALNQQHPSVSVTKIRQLLRADSAQKKREEEKERSEQVRLQRKAKEERAEAQKKQLLEERAVTAKQKREQRLLHAAEVRKAREKARIEQKLKEEQAKKVHNNHTIANETIDSNNQESDQKHQINGESNKIKPVFQLMKDPRLDKSNKKKEIETKVVKDVETSKQQETIPEEPAKQMKANETFQKIPEELNNIDISVCDETTEEQRKHPQPIATWAKAPGLREAIVAQYSRPESALLRQAMDIFGGVKLPVVLEEIFGPSQAVIRRYLCRTSSAVWSTPHRPIKRTSSDVLTPTDPKKYA